MDTELKHQEREHAYFDYEMSKPLKICDICLRSEIELIIDGTGHELLQMDRDSVGDMVCVDCLQSPDYVECEQDELGEKSK